MSRAFDEVSLASLELFCLAAEQESFTAAAHAAGLNPAAVSKAIAKLEVRLGVPLFARTTRKIRLTEAGRSYWTQCRQALNQLGEAEREITGRQQSPSGTVRISMATPYAHYRVLPRIAAFHARYPDVHVDMHLSNRNIDFVAEGYDLGIRARMQPDSGLVVRKLEDAPLVIVGSPAYLQRKGTPRTLEQLGEHDCIQFVLPSTGQPVAWMLRQYGKDLDVLTQGSSWCSEDPLGGITLARHGAGLVQTYRFIVEEDLAQGRLVEVLDAYAGRSRPFSLLYPMRRHMPQRVRVLVDFLLETAPGYLAPD
ncbi:LysR substrate-binding domain-containing protein [Leeia sp.]|uniref:LysR family transcriptional regulator n=1 Tax=Leeia sp. TaxID=2884678 RepID=UPI0035B04507